MKKFLLISCLFFCWIGAHGQGITFYDLLNLTNLPNDQAHNYITSSKLFKRQYLETIDGREIEHFQNSNPAAKQEALIIGKGNKTDNGSFLRIVTYETHEAQYIINLIAQAKTSEVKLIFHGADNYNNIYLFDDFLYNVKVYLRTDKTSGSVEVRQKLYIPIE